MKIGKIRLQYNGIPIDLDNLEVDITDLEAIKDFIKLGSKASKECYWSNVCSDYPSKCSTCQNNPLSSHYCKRWKKDP